MITEQNYNNNIIMYIVVCKNISCYHYAVVLSADECDVVCYL